MTWTIAVCIAAAVVSTASSISGATTFGNPLVPGEIFTSTAPRIFILKNFTLPRGNVVGFHIHPAVADQPLRMQIWRYLGDESYTLIGQVMHMTMSNDTVEDVPVPRALAIEAGDLLGFTMEHKDCPIAYTMDAFHHGSKVVSLSNFGIIMPVVGQVYHFTGNYFDKKFSASVDVELYYHCSNNNGGCSQLCEEPEGVLTCSCMEGYQLSKDATTCYDINECLDEPCGDGEACINTPGDYFCVLDSVAGQSSASTDFNHNVSLDIMGLSSPFLIIIIICWLFINSVLVVISLIYILVKNRRKQSRDSRDPQRDDAPIMMNDVTPAAAETSTRIDDVTVAAVTPAPATPHSYQAAAASPPMSRDMQVIVHHPPPRSNEEPPPYVLDDDEDNFVKTPIPSV